MKFDHQINQTKGHEKTHSGRSRRPIFNLPSTHQQVTHAFRLVDLAGLVLLGHSSLDRVMGYGLKFDISFCHPDGSGYCSRVINPSKQVEIHLAPLGQLPSRSITLAELQNLQVPSTAVLVPGAFIARLLGLGVISAVPNSQSR
ncbi:MAG: DUF4260 family protein [Bacteroidota bacterium]